MKNSLFPKNFLWGAATASYQVEGGIENCDWAQAAREGKVPTCGKACDHYNRYEEDFDVAKTLGHNAHRLSIEWARVEPEEGVFNEEALEHYRAVLRALHARGLKPLVTLYHFTLPLWLSKRGGWEHQDTPHIFARYCMRVVEGFGTLCDNYATINEPMVLASVGYIRGEWPPFCTHAHLRYVRVCYRLTQAHREAYRQLKERFGDTVSIGIVKHTVAFSANSNPFNKLWAFFSNLVWTRIFMARVHRACDWIGVNYYHRVIFGDTRILDTTDFGWKVDPEGVYDALRLLSVYGKPLYVSEAGCADATDRIRPEYIRGTVRGIERALEDGIDVRGYCYWSLLDNYEWAKGFTMRFGIVAVDFDTLERTIRPSAYVYRDLIQEKSSGE